jgi:hypothetical protein
MMAATFHGLRPFVAGPDVVEVETERGVRDLHNDAALEGVELLVLPRAEVRFRFRTSAGETLVLRFSDVVAFAFDPADALGDSWTPEEHETLYGISYIPGPLADRDRFVIDTILGSTRFAAAAVRAEWVAGA